MRPHGKARVNPSNPKAFACCDRCQLWFNRVDLRYQYDYRGRALSNLHLLVCETCYDKPQPQLKPRVIPPDPIPIRDPRPERYVGAGAIATGSVGAAAGTSSVAGSRAALIGAAAIAAGSSAIVAEGALVIVGAGSAAGVSSVTGVSASSGVAMGLSQASAVSAALAKSAAAAGGDSFAIGDSSGAVLIDGSIGSLAVSEGPVSGTTQTQ